MSCRRSLAFSCWWVDNLVSRYKVRNPLYIDVCQQLRADNLLTNKDPAVMHGMLPNDHMAMRTLHLPQQGLGLHVLDVALQRYGYQRRDDYYFAEKKIAARWYESPGAPILPRIFASELRVEQLPSEIGALLQRYVRSNSALALDNDAAATRHIATASNEAFLEMAYRNLEAMDATLYDKVPSRQDYETIRAATEYGAWTLLHGHRINHCTIPVQWLGAPYNAMDKFVEYAQNVLQLRMNDGGAVQQSDDGQLLQSSTQAVLGYFLFRGDTEPTRVPGSFLEFIERHREGFAIGNADRIFESTSVKQH